LVLLYLTGAKEVLGKEDSGWEEHDGLLTKDRLIYVPPDEALRHQILKVHHDDYLAGHPANTGQQSWLLTTTIGLQS
jgi:hypothetical protein